MNDNPMRPGAWTSEFWLTCGAAIMGFVTSLSSTDESVKWGSLGVAFGAIIKFMYGRYALKSQKMQHDADADESDTQRQIAKLTGPKPYSPPAVLPAVLACLLLFGLGAPVHAQPPQAKSVTWTHLLAYRDNTAQRLALLELQIKNQQTAPQQIIQQPAPQFIMMPGQQQQCPPDRSAEVAALQGQVSQLNGIISQLQLQQRAPQMMAQPIVQAMPIQQQNGPATMYHYHWYMGQNGQPMVQGPFMAPQQFPQQQQQQQAFPQQISLPIQQGPPLQQLPIQQQAPLQILPIQQGAPLQVLPIQQQAPLQVIPQQQTPPLQILPIQTLPPQQHVLPIQQQAPQIQVLPIQQQQQNGPVPLPIQQQKPMPIVPQNANGPPTGYQRFTNGGLQLQDPLGSQPTPGQNYQPPIISSYRTYERRTP